MIFIVEAMILCVLFTVAILWVMRNPLSMIHDYPPAIIRRVKELGLITEEQLPGTKKTLVKKLCAAILMAAVLGVIVYFVNDADSFEEGFLISYGLWCIVDWYDALVLDILWFCHDKRFVIKGTEDMVQDYHDYGFHIRGSLKGMFIGLPVCQLVGLATLIMGKVL